MVMINERCQFLTGIKESWAEFSQTQENEKEYV